jgi:hypothetical protein
MAQPRGRFPSPTTNSFEKHIVKHLATIAEELTLIRKSLEPKPYKQAKRRDHSAAIDAAMATMAGGYQPNKNDLPPEDE